MSLNDWLRGHAEQRERDGLVRRLLPRDSTTITMTSPATAP